MKKIASFAAIAGLIAGAFVALAVPANATVITRAVHTATSGTIGTSDQCQNENAFGYGDFFGHNVNRNLTFDSNAYTVNTSNVNPWYDPSGTSGCDAIIRACYNTAPNQPVWGTTNAFGVCDANTTWLTRFHLGDQVSIICHKYFAANAVNGYHIWDHIVGRFSNSPDNQAWDTWVNDTFITDDPATLPTCA